MTNDKGILIQNIYYMLAYAFQVLKQNNYEEIASEAFDDIQNLFAAILEKGIAQQLKQGLYRAYTAKEETLPVLRGKLNIQGTIRSQIRHGQVLACEYDELTENNIFNQILKTTAMLLIQDQKVSPVYRRGLKKAMLFFAHVDTVAPASIPWSLLRFQRSNRNYQMLLNICYFVLDGLLQTTEKGAYRMAAFSDEHMARLYERFILEYYKKRYPRALTADAAQVKWNLDSGTDKDAIRFLPTMQTDITLRDKQTGKILIIDAKYYGRTMQSHYDRDTFHSGNLYQIFTYVKNLDKDLSGQVSGMLLYAKTEEAVTPDAEFSIGGNRFSVKTLDLNRSFPLIAKQLDDIIQRHFGLSLLE